MKIHKLLAGLALVLTTLTAGLSAHASVGTGTMSVIRMGHAASSLPDGRVLVSGGVQGSSANLGTNKVDIYNPATGLFSVVAPMSVPRYAHASVVLADGRVIVIGGVTNYNAGTLPLATTEIYDPATNTWSAGAPMAVARPAPKAAKLSNGKIVVIDGYGSSTEVYDPATGTFSASGALAAPRSSFAIAVLPDDRVVAAGGYASGALARAIEVRDPLTGAWSSPATLAFGRMDASVTPLLDGRVLIAGGGAGSWSFVSELFDPATSSVSSTVTMPFSRTQHTANLLQSGNVILAGGNVSQDADVEAVLHYDVAANLWRMADRIPVQRLRHTATVLTDGKVLVAGGSTSNSATPQLFSEECAIFNSTLSAVSNAFAAEGGSTTIALTIPETCAWNIDRVPSWIAVTPAVTGTGSTMITLTAAPGVSYARSATMRIANIDFRVTQPLYAPPCDTSVTPTLSEMGRSFIGQGGSASVSVTIGNNCTWWVSNYPEWITVNSPGYSGKAGSGVATFTVKPNTGGARSFLLSIANIWYEVKQGAYGSGCDATLPTSISPASRNFTTGGGDGVVSISKGPDCLWSVSTLPGWIVSSSAMSGVGTSSFSYAVLSNGGPARSATVTIAGQSHLVTQEGVPVTPPPVCPVTPLTLGSAYAGTLAMTDCTDGTRGTRYYVDRYSFSGTAGQRVAIELSSSAFDAYVYLKGPTGTVLAQNDDGGGGTNSRIPATSGSFTLPATGTYVIEATTYLINYAGNYTVRVVPY